MWDNIKELIGGSAPLIGSMVGGPAGGAIGGLIAGVLGVKDDPKSIENELKNNPDALLKLKKYELDNSEHIAQMKLEDTKLRIGDINNARKRQIEHEKATGETDINLYVLAWVIVVGFFALIGVLMFVQLPTGSNDVVFMLLGTLSAGFGAVMQYFFGTSQSSSKKNDHIKEMYSIQAGQTKISGS